MIMFDPQVNILVNWSLLNFGLSMAILATSIIIVHMIVNLFTRKVSGSEIIFRWIVLLPVGATSLYSFVMHAFFPVFTAATIGWDNSLFQFHIAMANLAFGVVAVCAFSENYSFRLATVIGITCWFWGNAAGTAFQMINKHDYVLSHVDSWSWLSLLLPTILILCMPKIRNAQSMPKIMH